tara:strand:- start:107 stop:598 length:492 start_codon:yes stop_codon:yes gene_type:complete
MSAIEGEYVGVGKVKGRTEQEYHDVYDDDNDEDNDDEEVDLRVSYPSRAVPAREPSPLPSPFRPHESSFSCCGIKSLQLWNALAHRSDESAYASTETVKVILDLRPMGKRMLRNIEEDFGKGYQLLEVEESQSARAYFLQTKLWTWHFPFAKRYVADAQHGSW